MDAVKWTYWMLFGGASLTTFASSVMAEEQTQRLRNGAIGTAAGSFAGAVMALITNDRSLLLVGFVASGIGAFAGWVTSVMLSVWAARTSLGRTVLEYQIGGWSAVRNKLNLDEKDPLLSALRKWTRNYSRMVSRERSDLLKMSASTERNKAVTLVIRGWLVGVVEVVDLLFELGKRPNYRSRATIIVFGTIPVGSAEAGSIQGKHWISDAGRLPGHKEGRTFSDKSIGYHVLREERASPHFTPSAEAKSGDDRGEAMYRPFLTFRLNHNAILAVDWPEDLVESDPFFQVTRDLFQLDMNPSIQELLDGWTGNLSEEVGLAPLPK